MGLSPEQLHVQPVGGDEVEDEAPGQSHCGGEPPGVLLRTVVAGVPICGELPAPELEIVSKDLVQFVEDRLDLTDGRPLGVQEDHPRPGEDVPELAAVHLLGELTGSPWGVDRYLELGKDLERLGE